MIGSVSVPPSARRCDRILRNIQLLTRADNEPREKKCSSCIRLRPTQTVRIWEPGEFDSSGFLLLFTGETPLDEGKPEFLGAGILTQHADSHYVKMGVSAYRILTKHTDSHYVK